MVRLYGNRLKKKAWALVRDESGQTTTEYVLLIVLVVFVVKQLKQVMVDNLQRLIGNAFQSASQNIE